MFFGCDKGRKYACFILKKTAIFYLINVFYGF